MERRAFWDVGAAASGDPPPRRGPVIRSPLAAAPTPKIPSGGGLERFRRAPRRFLPIAWAALFLVGGFARGEEGQGFSTSFASPPYAVDASVIGTEGWKAALPTTNAKLARVLPLPWAASRTGLLLSGYGLDREFAKVTGRANLAVVFGIGRLSPTPGQGQMQLIPFIGGRPDSIVVGFDNAEGGGFYYEVMDPSSTKSEPKGMVRTVFCPRARLVEEALYELSLDMDLETRVFGLAFTGPGTEGRKVEVRIKDVDFSNFWSQKFINGIRVINGVPNSIDTPHLRSADLYLASLSIQPAK
jgi:hypothetical protein